MTPIYVLFYSSEDYEEFRDHATVAFLKEEEAEKYKFAFEKIHDWYLSNFDKAHEIEFSIPQIYPPLTRSMLDGRHFSKSYKHWPGYKERGNMTALEWAKYLDQYERIELPKLQSEYQAKQHERSEKIKELSKKFWSEVKLPEELTSYHNLFIKHVYSESFTPSNSKELYYYNRSYTFFVKKIPIVHSLS